MGQIPCIAGFLGTNNKRVDRSIVSMLRSMFGGSEETRTLDLTDANRALSHAGRFSLNSDYKNILKDAETGSISCFLTLSLRA